MLFYEGNWGQRAQLLQQTGHRGKTTRWGQFIDYAKNYLQNVK